MSGKRLLTLAATAVGLLAGLKALGVWDVTKLWRKNDEPGGVPGVDKT